MTSETIDVQQVLPNNFMVAVETGQDDFWIVDAVISYRLPKRFGFITLGVKNLLDEEFNYFDTDTRNPTIQPERTIFGRATVSF